MMMNQTGATGTAHGEIGKYPSLPMHHALAPYSGAVWRHDATLKMQYRDLNLSEASGGQMGARHLRVGASGVLAQWPASPDCRFQCVFLLAGRLSLTRPDGQKLNLNAWDTVYLQALRDARDLSYSSDFEALQISSPAEGIGPVDPVELMRVPAVSAASVWSAGVNLERPESYVLGDGPRSYFRYRDIGAAALTDRRIHIHLIQATGSMPGGTGWHDHSMSQLFYVLGGSAVVRVENHGEVRMMPGDAMCIPAELDHDVPEFEANYQVLEMCLPGDYSTINQDRKEIALVR